jgi:hypothetical protein
MKRSTADCRHIVNGGKGFYCFYFRKKIETEQTAIRRRLFRRNLHTWVIEFMLPFSFLLPVPQSVSQFSREISIKRQKASRRRGKYSLWIVYQICCCNYYFSFFFLLFLTKTKKRKKKNRKKFVDCIEFL